MVGTLAPSSKACVRSCEHEVALRWKTGLLARRACARGHLRLALSCFQSPGAQHSWRELGRAWPGLGTELLLFSSGLVQAPCSGAFVSAARPGQDRGGRGRPKARTHRQPSRTSRRRSLIRLPSVALTQKGAFTPFCRTRGACWR